MLPPNMSVGDFPVKQGEWRFCPGLSGGCRWCLFGGAYRVFRASAGGLQRCQTAFP